MRILNSFPEVNRRTSGLFIISAIIVLITFLAISNINLGKDYKSGKMEADGKGYYAYLPAVFIYHDLSFRFFYQVERQTYYDPNYLYNYLREYKGKTINKYFAGTALCMLPFFLIGHLFTLFSNYPPDGYSYFYMLWIHLGALFYLFAGLIALGKLLKSYDIRDKWIRLTLPAIVFGTNLFYYVLTEFSMSHIYSFTLITSFLLCARLFLKGGKNILAFRALIILGIITLIRPINIVILISIPFLADSPEMLRNGLKRLLKAYHSWIPGITGFLLIVSIQPIIYKIQTGSFFVYSYPGEGFNFLQPHIFQMLFSYRKGLFLYTPLLLVSLLGFYYLWKTNKYQLFTLAGFLMIITYLFSSWHMWYYGGSFSQRVFIDFFALFAILLGITLNRVTPGLKRNSLLITIFLLCLFCQYQTYQYRHMVIHWSDMTRDLYWDGMFKLNP
ncbi:MAG: hypothetical protein IPH84_06520 [Bacteroidales bacterium]|nr:hypothetical protein [Bacteroidales bacterium]